LRVIDQDTGKPYFLDRTPELDSDLDGFAKSHCAHDNVEIRQRMHGGGALHFYRQCTRCGKSIGSALKKVVELESSLPWNVELVETFHAAREAERCAIYQKHVRKQRERADGFKRKYDIYLESPEWREKRAVVLKRANGVCEGCLLRKATQVHHTTYDHFGDEFMFELIAICDECHKRLHTEKFEKNEVDREPSNEWRDGFACDGCRWQDSRESRRWCSVLEVLAVDALAQGGQCGPKHKLLDPLK
jgi:hypothetical protein